MGKEKINFKQEAVDEENCPQKVSDLLDEQGKWKSSLVWRLFDPEVADKILSIHIPANKEEDEILWGKHKSGTYSIKSGYWNLLYNFQDHQNAETLFWKKIVEHEITTKLKIFHMEVDK